MIVRFSGRMLLILIEKSPLNCQSFDLLSKYLLIDEVKIGLKISI